LGPNSTLDGPFRLDIKPLADPFSSERLVSLYRIGKISNEDFGNRAVERVARDVPADGNPSQRTGQTFTCRVWIGDVVAELGRRGVLELKKSIGKSPDLQGRDITS
jgi:hypothetical protein